MGPGATSQAGTIRDPAVIGSSLFGGWRLDKFALQLLGLACGDGNCTNKAAAAKGSLQIIGDAAKYSASELNAAQHIAKLGNSVILRPPSNVARTSDLLVNGMPYDVYTPITSNANRIISAIAHKSSQAQGIVLDLSRTSVTAQDLGNILARVQGTGAKNIVDIVIIGGK